MPSNRYSNFTALLILLPVLVCALASPAHASVIQLQPNNLGLVAYWSFNEGTSTTATDFSGNGNTGTLNASALPTWVVGKHGNALNFSVCPGTY